MPHTKGFRELASEGLLYFSSKMKSQIGVESGIELDGMLDAHDGDWKTMMSMGVSPNLDGCTSARRCNT